MDRERLAKLAGSVRTGGKGSMRRKKKAVHKTTTTDDKRLQNTLKRLGVNVIPGIEEVNIIKDDGFAIYFTNPKVQASIAANTFVVSGPSTSKKFDPVSQLGNMDPGMLAELKKLATQYHSTGAGAGGDGPGALVDDEDEEDDDDDDVPDLVENFEEASK